MSKQKSFKDRITKEIEKMVFDLKKMFSVALMLVGLYYLLVSAKIIHTQIIWFINSPIQPTSQNVLIVAIIMLIIGILLNEQIMRKLKNVFS